VLTAIRSHRPQRGWSDGGLPALDSEQTLVVAFGAAECLDRDAPLRELAAAFPRAQLVGCSTAGEIFGTSIDDGTVSVAICRFQGTRLRSASAPVAAASDSREAGRTIARTLAAPDLRGVIVLSDGLHVNGSELLGGLNEVLPATVVVTGGLAGDGPRFQHTWVLHQGRPREGWVSAVGLYGDRIVIGHGSQGGWDIFGPERLVTRSAGNVLQEIDGRPALDLYKAYLGELAEGLPANALLFPLSLRREKSEQGAVVRTILGVSEADKSLTFAGDIPCGSLVQLMRANFDRLIDGASDAGVLTNMRSQAAGAGLAIAISCVGRRLVLGQRAEEEVEAVLHALPPETALVGFYSYGEISPCATDRCELHNQTMTLTHLAER
jgi:hypothetical protein